MISVLKKLELELRAKNDAKKNYYRHVAPHSILQFKNKPTRAFFLFVFFIFDFQGYRSCAIFQLKVGSKCGLQTPAPPTYYFLFDKDRLKKALALVRTGAKRAFCLVRVSPDSTE